MAVLQQTLQEHQVRNQTHLNHRRELDITIKATHIDRRTCQRTRPMELLCLGLERTGTLSLRVALTELGYADVYHMESALITNPSDGDLWMAAIDAKFHSKGSFTRADWDQLLGHCMAVTDQPAASFAEELLAAYPDAKVVLTVRDSQDVWSRSVKQTVQTFCDAVLPEAVRNPGSNPLQWIRRFVHPRAPFSKFLERLIEAWDIHRKGWRRVDAYERHNEWIRRLAKEQGRHFLEFNVKEGWGPLCSFLGKPVPDSSFPHVNDAAEFAKMIVDIRRKMVLGYAISMLKCVAVLVFVMVAANLVLSRR